MRAGQSTIEKRAEYAIPSGVGSPVKVSLAHKLNELIDMRGLNQSEVAEIIGMTQPKVSQIRRCQLQNISLERLLQALVSLGQRVEIVVEPAPDVRASGIRVTQ
ncbi:XRE family transcriptional regulator [Janthinobacterium sp. BJB412]|nr:XRE family transcriptional regulator [Janthinobacterium sp. BJB412]